jgi:polyhydroxybutyrate depolymerase
MRHSRVVLGAALALISVPVVVTAIEAAVFFRANRSNGAIVSSGTRRDYVLHVPAAYDPGRATPLVISLHAAALWGAAQRDISQWNRVADTNGFLVVYPSAERAGPRVWHVEKGPGLMRDVRFISELIDTLEAHYDIDRRRIYANGLSNGGGMSFVLSCTLSDRIAAIGMVGAAQTLPWSWCTDRRPVPMIDFHGTADPPVPYAGGKTWIAPERFPNIPLWAANWARRNQCQTQLADSTVAPDVIRRAYTKCGADATVLLYTISGGGHTWPGGGALPPWSLGRTSTSIDASAEMWRFFRDHALR